MKTEEQILESVKQKAEELYPKPIPKIIPDDYYNDEFTNNYMEMEMLQSAFIKGYSLSQQEIEKIGNESMIFEMDLRNAKLEIERLKGVLEKVVKYFQAEELSERIWQQFKTDNNIEDAAIYTGNSLK